MNRRNFIKTSAIGSAALASPIFIKAQDKNLKIGIIGTGWYGMVLAKAGLKAGGMEVAAIADVDAEHLSNSAAETEKLQGKKPKTYKHYQDLLAHKGLDAIFIATPPHWHALQFIAACEAGLPVYCEKPLSYDVKEGEAMQKAAEKSGNIVQIGFQRRQSQAFHAVKDYIESGNAGTIRQVEAQIHYPAKIDDTTIQEPPASLDWDLWCGPAPKLAYRPSIGHFNWRLEKAYGHGHLVDWGIHHIDTIRMIMGLDTPKNLSAFGGIYKLKEINTPDALTVNFGFDKVPVTWNHRLWGPAESDPQFNNSITFYGDEATLVASDHKWIIVPNKKDADQEVNEIRTADMQERHVAEFLKAVQKQDPAMISCPLVEGYKSTASVQLAMVAYEGGEKIDYANGQLKASDNTRELLKRDYRGDYQHPA